MTHDANEEIRIPRRSGPPRPLHAQPPPSDPKRDGPAAPPRKSPPLRPALGAPKPRDWYFFAVEFRTALHAGVPMLRALELAAAGTSRRGVRRAALFLRQAIAEGKNLPATLAARDDIPPLIRNLLIAGHRGGSTVESLDLLISHYRWVLEIRGLILRAILYPAMLALCGGLVMVLRDTAIDVLARGRASGPAALDASARYFGVLLAGAAAGWVLAWFFRLPAIRPGFDSVARTIPFAGKVLWKYSQTVFFRVLAAMIETGMPVTTAWQMAAQSAPNREMERRLAAGLPFLQDGESVEEALKQSGAVDRGSLGMAAAGEAAGSLPELLRRHAAFSEQALRSSVKGIVALFSPVCIAMAALAFFYDASWLGILMFFIVLARRMI